MSSRPAPDRRPQASRRGGVDARLRDSRSGAPPASAPARRRGPRIGPVAVTPLRVTLFVALLGGLAFLGYAVVVRDQLQVPMMASGFAVIGLVFAAIAAIAVVGVVRAGSDGRDGTAVLTALFGGLFAVAALMCLAGAMIMSLIWSGTRGA